MITLYLDNRACNLLDADLKKAARDIAGENHLREPLLRSAKEVLAPSIDRNFAVGGRPNTWEVSYPDSWYRRKYGMQSAPPLWVTGKLKKAATAMARFNVNSNRLTYGYFPPTLWFAGVLEKGSQSASIPARPWALIQPEDVDAITEIFGQWIEEKISDNVGLVYV